VSERVVGVLDTSTVIALPLLADAALLPTSR